MALPGIAGWKTELVRVTLFANEPVSAIGKNWWQAATGVAPESVLTKPQASEHTESGPMPNGEGVLEVKVSFNRVDWLHYSTPNMEVEPPTLGEASASLNSLTSFISNWLDSDSTPWIRIAYGAVCQRKAENFISANECLISYCPQLKFDPNQARDLALQVNFPRRSQTSADLEVNRICKLMTSVAQFITFNPGAIAPSISNQHFSRIELDINTPGEQTNIISRTASKELLNEFINQSLDILDSGLKP